MLGLSGLLQNKAGTRRCGMCDSQNPAFPAPAPARRRSISPTRAVEPEDG
jgi:hypothetical protein